MSKSLRFGVLSLVFGAMALAGLTACGPGGGAGAADKYPWVTVDENYKPADSVEEFIKTDSANRGLLPVSIKNYGHDPDVLKRFRGSRFAAPNPAVIEMFFKGMSDWKVLDLKYKNKKKQEVLRTVLYVEVGGAWTVADSGGLLK